MDFLRDLIQRPDKDLPGKQLVKGMAMMVIAGQITGNTDFTYRIRLMMGYTTGVVVMVRDHLVGKNDASSQQKKKEPRLFKKVFHTGSFFNNHRQQK